MAVKRPERGDILISPTGVRWEVITVTPATNPRDWLYVLRAIGSGRRMERWLWSLTRWRKEPHAE